MNVIDFKKLRGNAGWQPRRPTSTGERDPGRAVLALRRPFGFLRPLGFRPGLRLLHRLGLLRPLGLLNALQGLRASSASRCRFHSAA